MTDALKNHISDLKKFDFQRIMWLKLSAFVFASIILVLIDFLLFDYRPFYWIVIPLGLIISVGWWYWTMRIVRILLTHRIDEVIILKELADDIKEVKNEIKKLDTTS